MVCLYFNYYVSYGKDRDRIVEESIDRGERV